MTEFKFYHIHLLSRDPMATARFYEKMFAAKILESVQSDGKPRVDLDLNGLAIFILRVTEDRPVVESPPGEHLGLDHFGFLVKDIDGTVAELKGRGAEFSMEPRTIRPGVRIAYLRAPENVRIELVERK